MLLDWTSWQHVQWIACTRRPSSCSSVRGVLAAALECFGDRSLDRAGRDPRLFVGPASVPHQPMVIRAARGDEAVRPVIFRLLFYCALGWQAPAPPVPRAAFARVALAGWRWRYRPVSRRRPLFMGRPVSVVRGLTYARSAREYRRTPSPHPDETPPALQLALESVGKGCLLLLSGATREEVRGGRNGS